MKKQLQILVVEDNLSYQEMCKSFVDYINSKGRIVSPKSIRDSVSSCKLPDNLSIDIVQSKDSALSALASKKYAGCVCDLFFPTSENGNTTQEDRVACQALLKTAHNYQSRTYNPKIAEYVDSLDKSKDIIPLGVLVGSYAIGQKIFRPLDGNIPFVFCTNGHHHGTKTQAVTDMVNGSELGTTLGLVDTIEGKYDQFENHARGKNFVGAFYRLFSKGICPELEATINRDSPKEVRSAYRMALPEIQSYESILNIKCKDN